MTPAYDRNHPFPARLVDKRLLTGAGSSRPTLHVAFSIAGASFHYEPGDVVALYVRNEPELVDAVLQRLGLGGDELVAVPAAWTRVDALPTARWALTERLSLGTPSRRLLRAAAERLADEDEAIAIEDLCDDDVALDAYLDTHDLLDFLEEHPTLALTAAELPALLPGLTPRTYSIASSPRVHPDEVHLTVGLIAWERAGRVRRGVASAQLERMQIGEALPLYWQSSKHFRMPGSEVPLILIGPGTGIAPFRGFLQERAATGGAETWLTFGAQTRAHDYYYADELATFGKDGPLARLDLAFSRDQVERVYVQHQLRAAGDELFDWLERGASVYLCGDASKMAPDVERTLVEIIDAHGKDGTAYLARLRADQRYRRDVY